MTLCNIVDLPERQELESRKTSGSELGCSVVAGLEDKFIYEVNAQTTGDENDGGIRQQGKDDVESCESLGNLHPNQ